MSTDLIILKAPANTLATEEKQDDTIETLQSIAGMNIPSHDQIVYSYPDTETSVRTFKKDTVEVAVLTIVTDTDGNLLSKTLTI
jgi:hypothetical protein